MSFSGLTAESYNTQQAPPKQISDLPTTSHNVKDHSVEALEEEDNPCQIKHLKSGHHIEKPFRPESSRSLSTSESNMGVSGESTHNSSKTRGSNILQAKPQIIAPDLSQLNSKSWNLDSRTSIGGPFIVYFPVIIPDGAYMLSVNKASPGGIFKMLL